MKFLIQLIISRTGTSSIVAVHSPCYFHNLSIYLYQNQGGNQLREHLKYLLFVPLKCHIY